MPSRPSRTAFVFGQSNANELLGAAMAGCLSKDRFFAQTCRGGTGISTWINDDLTATATLIADVALMFEGKQFTDLDLILFHGESDATGPLAPKHRAKVEALIAYLKATIGAEVMRCVFILPWKKGSPGLAEGYLGVTVNPSGAGDIVRAGLVALGASNANYRVVDSQTWERIFTETGTVSATINTVTLTGVGTTWLTDKIAVGDSITIAGQVRTIATNPRNTSHTVTANWTPAIPGGTTFSMGDSVHVKRLGFIGDNFPYVGGTYPNNVKLIADTLNAIP